MAFFSSEQRQQQEATVTPLELRQLYGDVVETATLARILLDPVASKLSGDPSSLHRRCVIGRYLDFFSHPDGVRDDLAPFGAIEAVSVLQHLHHAVVVFWDEASVATALQRQAETPSPGWFAAVPSLNAALPIHRVPDYLIKAELYPPIAATATLAAAPLFWFRNSSDDEAAMVVPLRRDPGTTWFMPSRRSRVQGPVLGADGHLWMDGLNILFLEDGIVGFQLEPASIRVAPLDPPGGDDPPTYVPLFSTAANPMCVPHQNSGSQPVPAGTAMLSLLNLRELHGDVVETATIARDILAPAASQLSGDPSKLHRRCVLGWFLDWLSSPNGVRNDLAPFGAIEAVALCKCLHMAVIVFWDEASVAVALGRQAEASDGWFTAVPPLDAALPLRFVTPSAVKVALYPQAPAKATLAPPRPLRTLFGFQNSPHEPPLIPFRGDAGTTWFLPSRDSLLYGPVLGADDHLWMDGHNIVYYEESVRSDPSWIRVAPLNSPGIYCGEPPMFVPLFSA